MENIFSAMFVTSVGTCTVGIMYQLLKIIWIHPHAGSHPSPTSFTKKIFLACTGALITGLIVLSTSSSTEAAMLALAVLPSFWILSLFSGVKYQKKRRALITREFPLLLDYLALQLESGHSIQQSLRTAHGLFVNGGPLNMGLLELDESIRVGSSLVQALEEFGRWLDTPEADLSITAIAQAIQHGTPLGKALREQSKMIRDHLILDGEQFANTVSVKILIPLLFFIFPASFLVIFSPVVVSLSGGLP